MKNKKIVKIIIELLICAIAAIATVVACIYVIPGMKLKGRLEELINETYTYSVDCTVEGMGLKVLGDEFTGKISGTKGEEVLHGELYYKNKAYLEIYVDSEYDIIFCADDLFGNMLEGVEDKIGLPVSMLSLLIKDINISVEQLEEIIGKDIITISDSGITSEVFRSISGEKSEKAEYSLKRLKAKEDMLLGKDAVYFEITMKEKNAGIIIGVPDDKDDKRIAIEILYGDIIWSFVGEYELTDDDDIRMPTKKLSDGTIDILKKIYQYWSEEHKAS